MNGPADTPKPRRPVHGGDFAAGERTSVDDVYGSDYARVLRTREADEGRPDFAAGERRLPRNPRAHPDYARGLHREEADER